MPHTTQQNEIDRTAIATEGQKMFQKLTRLSRSPSRTRSQRRRARVVSTESLETRVLLSADPLTITDYRAFPDGQSNEVVYSSDPAPSRGSDARVVTYDPVTGKQRRLSKADSASARASIEVLDYTTHQAFADLGEFVEGQRAADVTLDGPDGQLVQPVDGGTEYQPNFIFGGDQRTLVPNTQVTPHRQIGRVWMNFGGRESSCSGTMIGPFHVLTAGHCMHTDGEWADSITFRLVRPEIASTRGLADLTSSPMVKPGQPNSPPSTPGPKTQTLTGTSGY